MHRNDAELQQKSPELPGVGKAGLSAASLLLANAGLLLIYISYDLTLYQLVLIYWWEGFWIGLFSALKLIVASLLGDPYRNDYFSMSPGSRLLTTLLLLLKVGAVFFGVLAAAGLGILMAADQLLISHPDDAMINQVGLIVVSSLLFMISHGLSFVINFLIRGEYRNARAGLLIVMPFKRCLALYAAIALAFVVARFVPLLATTTGFAALVIAAKLLWDFRLHKRERQTFVTAAQAVAG